jgi:hypothetical protein
MVSPSNPYDLNPEGKVIRVMGGRQTGKSTFVVESISQWLKGDPERRATVVVSNKAFIPSMKSAFAKKGVSEPCVDVIAPKDPARATAGIFSGVANRLLAFDRQDAVPFYRFREEVLGTSNGVMATEWLADFQGLVVRYD